MHQLATRDSNPYQNVPGTFNYGPNMHRTAPEYQLRTYRRNLSRSRLQAEPAHRELNARFTPNFSVMGFYTLNFANGDTGTASNSYNLKQDYGRASFVRRNMVFLIGNYTGKWGISYNPFLVRPVRQALQHYDRYRSDRRQLLQRPAVPRSQFIFAAAGTAQYAADLLRLP